MNELRKQFEKETGTHWENSQGEPDIDYVAWLETRLLKYLALPTNFVARPAIVDNEFKNKITAAIKEAEKMIDSNAKYNWAGSLTLKSFHEIDGMKVIFRIFKKAVEK